RAFKIDAECRRDLGQIDKTWGDVLKMAGVALATSLSARLNASSYSSHSRTQTVPRNRWTLGFLVVWFGVIAFSTNPWLQNILSIATSRRVRAAIIPISMEARLSPQNTSTPCELLWPRRN